MVFCRGLYDIFVWSRFNTLLYIHHMSSSKPGAPNKVRIIGGRWRGTALRLSDRSTLRPSPSRVRETLFNWLAGHLEDASCVDLFSGSGALGLEALSRGAARLTCVERHRATAERLKQRIDDLGASDRATVVCADVRQWLPRAKQSFDLLFLDPPFDDAHRNSYPAMIDRYHIAREGGLVYVESARRAVDRVPTCWQIHKQHAYPALRATLYRVNRKRAV